MSPGLIRATIAMMLAAPLFATVSGVSAQAAAPRLMCEFILMPLPNGGVIQVPIQCCDLDSLFPTCWHGEDDPEQSLALPPLPDPVSVAPLRVIDRTPQLTVPDAVTPTGRPGPDG